LPAKTRFCNALAFAIWGSLSIAHSAWAQGAGSVPVVQPLPPPQVADLNGALRRLASNPQDVTALIDAGHASLALDDVDAAVGFFSRAENLAPGDPKAKAGLAAAYVRSENPYDAILLFEQAQQAGASLNDVSADLGLAYDLVGANEQAQAYYRNILSRGADAEVARRLAVSLAITGDRSGAEAALRPLLEQRDLAAYRVRAFALAIMGDAKGALEIVNAVMPAEMAGKLAPYMRYMPRLTPAQQAAAANFGHFPRTADIGRDDPRVARFQGKAISPRGVDSALVPVGELLGKGAIADAVVPKAKKKKDKAKPLQDAALVANASPAPVSPPPPPPPPSRVATQDAAPVARIERLEQAAAQAPAAANPLARPSFSAISAAQSGAGQDRSEPAPQPRPPQAQPPQAQQPQMGPVPTPSFDLAGVDGSRRVEPAAALPAQPDVAAAVSAPLASIEAVPTVETPAATASVAPASAPQPSAEPAPAPSVADAFADFAVPAAPVRPVAAGAVDITRIKPKREEPPAPKVDEKPKPPAHPSRVWVQLATGRDLKALGFDWRRFTRQAADPLKGRKPFYTRWGQANRLLTGPFDALAAATAMVKKLKDAGVDSFTFTSDEGQEISPLGSAK